MNSHKLLVSVLMLVSVLLSACASATATPIPSTAVPPTAAPTVVPDQELKPFSSDKFPLPMSVSFGPEWELVVDSVGEILLVGGTRAYDGVELAFMFVKDAKIADPASKATMPWPDDFVAYLHSNQYLEVGEPMPTTVGGKNGVQIDVSVKNIGQRRDFIVVRGDSPWLYLDYDQSWRFVILDDVHGQRLLIATTEAPEGFSVATELAQKVIDSVVFTKPAATTFSPKTFNLPITLRYGSEWRIAEEYSDVFTLSYAGHDAGVSFMNVKNAKYADGIAFPDDFVTWIQSPDSLFQVEDSKPVLVGGLKGTQINAIGTCGEKTMWIILSGTGWWCPSGGHMGFIYLDNIYGERVLIEIQGSPGDKDYQFIVEESQKVLDTVVFSEPTTAFSSKTFDLPITFSYGPDWKIDSEISSDITLKYKDYDGEFLFINPKTAKVAGPAAPYSVIQFPDDFANWIQAHGLFQVVKAQSILVGGLSGTQIDADATSACGARTEWFFVGPGGWICSTGGHYRFTYLDDVNGERVLIMTVGYVSPEDFALMTDASQKILDTVLFSKP